MTILEALNYGSKQLSFAQSPKKEAALLMSFLLKKDRKWILLNEDKEFLRAYEFFDLVNKRANKTPLEYILGSVSFYSKEFEIKEGVLIPRPETELLIDRAVELLKDLNSPLIIEIGTGSGVVAIMLATLLKDSKIVATDVSLKAIALAKRNAQLHGVSEKITFVHTSMLDGISGEFDLLVSNPPYISNSAKLDDSVLQEPHLALFGGDTGDEFLKELIFKAKEKRVSKYIACEMGYDQKETMKETLNAAKASFVSFYKDLAGLDRGFSAMLF